jgi:hydroxyacylglutathione hydrolase
MEITIQMLGTGSAFGKKYNNNNALITCNGYKLLVDCGITAPRALFELDIQPNMINGIFITHLHADHVGGLEEVALQMMYIYKKKPTLLIPGPLRKTLWENTLKGGMESITDQLVSLENYFDIIQIEEGIPLEIHPGFTIETFYTKHILGKPSYALLLNDALFYSADTRFDPQLLNHVHAERNCSYILHDCQLYGPETVHATLPQLLTLPAEIQAKMFLMHYGDNMEDFMGRTGKMTFLKQHEIYRFPLKQDRI